MKLIYFAPSGEEDRDFAVADLAPMLRKGGTSYWNAWGREAHCFPTARSSAAGPCRSISWRAKAST